MATISMHHVRAALHGVTDPTERRRLLVRSGINPGLLRHPARRVHTEQAARLFRNVQLALDDEFMGMSAARCRVGAFRTMCELVCRCRTLGELLPKAFSFYRLLAEDVSFQLAVEGSLARVAVRHRSPERDPDHFLREFLLVIWHRFPSWYLGEPIRLRETRFSYPEPPAHEAELAVMFPGGRTFGWGEDALVFEAEYLARPLVRKPEELERFAANAPADVMTIPGVDDSLERRLMRLLAGREGEPLSFPPVREVAARLGLSVPTLYRRLRQQGTSYQKIKDDLRRERAIRHLVKDGLPVERVSELVGFTEARSFTRAFRQWTGMSPREYRRQLG